MVKSTNQGTTWTAPARLPFRPLAVTGDMFFPWLEYTPDGRLHLLSFDTAYTIQNDGGSHGMIDQDYAYSDDDGSSWARFRLTPASFDSFNDGRSSSTSFLGDYSGIGAGDRTVFPIYLDTHSGTAKVYTNSVFNPIVRPSAFTFFRGGQLDGNLQSLYLKDGNFIDAQPGVTVAIAEPPIQLETSATSPSPNPSSLQLYYWSSVNVPFIQQTVQMLNVTTGNWDTLDTRTATATQSNTVVTVPTPANYIAPNGLMRARLCFLAVGPVLQPGWIATTDEAVFLVGP
jgi:hypothetical protein